MEGGVERRGGKERRILNKERWNNSGTAFPTPRGTTYFFLQGRRLASWRYEKRQSHHTPSAAQSAHAKKDSVTTMQN